MADLNEELLYDNDDFDVDFDDENGKSLETEEKNNAEDVEESDEAEDTKNDLEVEEEKQEFEQEEKFEQREKATDSDDNFVLYIVSDRNHMGLINYFRSLGIKVSNVYSRIEDARDSLLMQVAKSRLVIVDTGTGRFTNTNSRKVLIDTIGISDEESRIAIFYTDSVLKAEVDSALSIADKDIQWYKYKTTADLAANILMLNKKENYVFDNEAENDKLITFKEASVLKGKKFDYGEFVNLGAPTISPQLVIVNLDDDVQSQIKAYDIRY